MWAGLFLRLSDDEVGTKTVSIEKYKGCREFLKNGTRSPLFQADAPDGVCIDLNARQINIQGMLSRDQYKRFYEQSRLLHDGIAPTTIEPCDLEGAICLGIRLDNRYENSQWQEVHDQLPDGEYILKCTSKAYFDRSNILGVKNGNEWTYYAPREGSKFSAAGTAIGGHPNAEYLAGVFVYGDEI
jgi:hypothetical protein